MSRIADEQILSDLSEARSTGIAEAASEPRADAVYYHPELGRVLVELKNGCVFGFRPSDVEDLAGAAAEDLARVTISPGGHGLHWEEIDVDVSVSGLLYRLMNVPAWQASVIGRRTSERKAAAARQNGMKGGRPRKGLAVGTQAKYGTTEQYQLAEEDPTVRVSGYGRFSKRLRAAASKGLGKFIGRGKAASKSATSAKKGHKGSAKKATPSKESGQRKSGPHQTKDR